METETTANKSENLGIKKKSRKSPFSSLNFKIGLILFVILIILVGASVLVINYARGVLPTADGLVATGNIRVNSEPADVKILLNNKETTVTNKLITNLTPGNYTVAVNRDGYLPWVKEVKVEAGVVKDLFIQLYPQSLKLSQLTKTNIQKLTFSANGEYAYYVVSQADKGEDIGIWRLRLTEPGALNLFNNTPSIKISNLTDNIRADILSGKFQLLPSPDNRRLVLSLSGEAKRNYILQADTYNEPAASNLLENKTHYSPKALYWINNSDELVLEAGNLLSAYNIASSRATVIDYTLSEDLIFSPGRSSVYFYKSTAEKLFTYKDGTVTEVTLENQQLKGKLTKIYTTGANEDTLYYTTSDNQLVYLNIDKSYQYVLPAGTNISEIARDGNAAILKQENGTYSIFTIEEFAALNRFNVEINELDMPNALLPIAARFAPNGNNIIIYTESGELYLTDRDGANATEAINKDVVIDPDNHTIESSSSRLFVLVTEKSAVNNSNLTTGDQQNTPEQNSKNIYYIDLRVR